MTEEQLQQAITDLARWLRLYVYHTRDSRGSAHGFPDLVLVGPAGVAFAELKSDTGTVSIDQKAWGNALVNAGQLWEVWRPADWHSGRVRRALYRLAGQVTQ
jgi:hypothetical protein